jgi:prepilin-type N-terminal cleavage/methylation domain-containing protein
MNTTSPAPAGAMNRPTKAFTLIELMVVISIIAILAALIFPIAGAARRAQIRNRAKAEMEAVSTALEQYKTKMGFYPPDNAPNWAVNQLYFELFGTTNIGPSTTAVIYRTLDGNVTIVPASLAFAYGPNVSGFMNSSKGGEDGVLAVNFARSMKASQYLLVTNNPSAKPTVALGMQASGAPGPILLQSPNGSSSKINPWCYNSSNPRYNPKSFDLWIDIIIANQTNRICNWSERPIIVSAPY